MTIEQQVCGLKLRDIQGHEDYFISPAGDVYSTKYGRLEKLSRSYDKRGYWKVFLSVRGKPKASIVHRLVAKLTPVPKC